MKEGTCMNPSDVNLRRAVLDNLTDSTVNDLRETILDAVQSGEDKILPGLGVLFELLWQNSDPSEQGRIIQAVYKGIH
jgi:small acid-soluble spore protein I (minor)